MSAYTLTVFHLEAPGPTEVLSLDGAVAVMQGLTRLLAKHPGCHRILVESGPTYLFSVDCGGATVALQDDA